MSKFSFLLPIASSLLGLVFGSKKDKPQIPKADIPNAPAPAAMQDTGASVSFGSSNDIKNQRVSGRSIKRTGFPLDFLGGLGKSGLKI